MIRLLYFIPCDRLLLDENQVSSLISVFESVIVDGKLESELPSNAAIPKQWTAVALWTRTEKVRRPTKFVSQIELIAPDGKEMMGGTNEFVVSNKFRNFRNAISFPNFPIGQSGEYILRLSYKQKASTSKLECVAEFPIILDLNVEKSL